MEMLDVGWIEQLRWLSDEPRGCTLDRTSRVEEEEGGRREVVEEWG